MDSRALKISAVVIPAVALTVLIFGVSLIGSGERRLRPVENIHGIPYARGENGIHIDEPLAHADIYIDQPVFGKELRVTVEFIPTNITGLSVGIRDNSFWLSYKKEPLYNASNLSTTHYQLQTTIPLTYKLQEPDQSIDLMFFAAGEAPEWELVSLKAEVAYAWPTWAQFKDYTRAV